MLAGLDGLPHRLGHLDLAGPFRAANAADGRGQEFGDIWHGIADASGWGHVGTVPRPAVSDDPAGARPGAAACHPGSFGYIRSLIERGGR